MVSSSSSLFKAASTTGTLLVAVTVATTTAVVASLAYWHHNKTIDRLSRKWEEKRLAERTGRIRAEVKLRTILKQQDGQDQNQVINTTTAAANDDNDAATAVNTMSPQMTLKCIGVISSPYTKRMGTPRQGSLVPSSRAFIQINYNKSMPFEVIDGLEQYSHLWVIFKFHANTDIISMSKKSKIKPPRSPPGVKVGQLATRSPHRPNPLGLSLVCIDYIDREKKRLYISGIDLVNGTPVYDIKPFVQWDIPTYISERKPYCDNDNEKFLHADNVLLDKKMPKFTVPEWVRAEDDILSRVEFIDGTEERLQQFIEDDGLLDPLYNSTNDGFNGAMRTIKEVLAQDPRSSTKRGTTTSKSSSSVGALSTKSSTSYKVVFGKLEIQFVVVEQSRKEKEGEKIVEVVDIHPIDLSNTEYVDGIPLVSMSTS